MKNHQDTAVLFIIFNRPDTTQKVFDAIRNAKPKRLYVAADAPRKNKEGDEEKCRLTRAIIEKVDWDCDLHTFFQTENIGCSLGPRTAFDWFFGQEEEGIILEDDCVPDLSFFRFCTEMLERYRNDEKIISINGCNLCYELNDGNSYTFSRFMNMWGWATWRRSAEKIDYYLEDWKTEQKPLWTLYKRLRQSPWDYDIKWYQYWQDKFDQTISRKDFTWWDWQWIYHQTKAKQFSIVPGVNLVSNIGFHEDATHTHHKENPAANLISKEMPFPLVHPATIRADIDYEEKYVKWVWCFHTKLPLLFYIKTAIAKLLKRDLKGS